MNAYMLNLELKWINLGREREGTTKKLCDKDFAERSGELSGALCLKTLVLLANHRSGELSGAISLKTLVRVNYLVRFASRPLFYWVITL